MTVSDSVLRLFFKLSEYDGRRKRAAPPDPALYLPGAAPF
ncbi:hypothetical protein V1278_005564 [Bradyrhizobium sp. AZCC 1577]